MPAQFDSFNESNCHERIGSAFGGFGGGGGGGLPFSGWCKLVEVSSRPPLMVIERFGDPPVFLPSTAFYWDDGPNSRLWNDSEYVRVEDHGLPYTYVWGKLDNPLFKTVVTTFDQDMRTAGHKTEEFPWAKQILHEDPEDEFGNRYTHIEEWGPVVTLSGGREIFTGRRSHETSARTREKIVEEGGGYHFTDWFALPTGFPLHPAHEGYEHHLPLTIDIPNSPIVTTRHEWSRTPTWDEGNHRIQTPLVKMYWQCPGDFEDHKRGVMWARRANYDGNHFEANGVSHDFNPVQWATRRDTPGEGSIWPFDLTEDSNVDFGHEFLDQRTGERLTQAEFIHCNYNGQIFALNTDEFTMEQLAHVSFRDVLMDEIAQAVSDDGYEWYASQDWQITSANFAYRLDWAKWIGGGRRRDAWRQVVTKMVRDQYNRLGFGSNVWVPVAYNYGTIGMFGDPSRIVRSRIAGK